MAQAAAILAADELRALTGMKRDADVIRCLREQGIAVFVGRNGPWTTADLVALAGKVQLGMAQQAGDDSML